MKKFLAIALAIVMTLALSVTAFAATLNDKGSVKGEATATYVDGASEGTVYCVNVTWTDLAFVFAYGQVWDTNELEYTDSASGAWTDATGTIEVENRSNAAVTVEVAFATKVDGIEMAFAAAGMTENAVELASAEDGTAKTTTITLTVSGTPASKAAELGTVTVTIK